MAKVLVRNMHLPVWAMLVWTGSVAAMEPMEDGEMSSVRAQEGISIGLEVRLNTAADGSALDGELTDCGTPGATSGDFTSSECRFALNAQNRTNEWVLFRGVYGSLLINDINLDAGILGNVSGAPSGMFDSARFEDPDGDCLLPTSCDHGSLMDEPALVFEYPDTSPGYSPSTGQSSGYDSLEVGYTIEETRIVFQNNGFNDTTTDGSFLGLEVSDNNAARAGIAISGQAYVYGF